MKRLYHGKTDVLNSSSPVLPFLQEKLAKSVNMRAMNMLGQAEERVRDSRYCVHCRDQRGHVWASGMSVGRESVHAVTKAARQCKDSTTGKSIG